MMEFVCLYILQLLVFGAIVYLKHWIPKHVDSLFQKNLSYQSEKGKNLATKEDIKEITESLETVKNEISFQKQRSHEFIKERERRFLNILFQAETVMNAINRLYLYGRNEQNTGRVLDLIDEVSKASLQMRQESLVCIAANYDLLKDNNPLTILVDDIQKLSCELLSRANNVANNLSACKAMREKAEGDDDITKVDTLQKALYISSVNIKLLDEPLQHKDVVNNDIIEYIKWLNVLYQDGLAINYDIELIKDKT